MSSPPKHTSRTGDSTSNTTTAKSSLLRALLLWAFILVGISLRFAGMNWDEAHQLHPDERFLTMTVPTLKWPQSLGEYFQTRTAPLNPFNNNVNFFIYGQLPLTMAKVVGTVFGCDNYDGIRIVGRFLSALFDAGSIFLLFFIGKRLAGKTVGLLSAALLAFTVLNIQQSHFFVVDTFASFFLLGAFLFALRWLDNWPQKPIEDEATQDAVRKRAKRDALACGFFWGASMACKIPCALFLLVVLLFAGALWRRFKPQTDAANPQMWRIMRIAAAKTAFLLIFSGIFWFRLLHPIAFEGSASPLTLWGFLDIRPATPNAGVGGQMVSFWNSFRETAEIASGQREMPWTLQWVGTPKVWFSLWNMGNWAIGWPLIAAGLGGIALALGRGFKKKPVPLGLVAAALWNLLIFFYYSTTLMKYTRYYLMLTPFLALCAAWFCAQLWRWSQEAGKINGQKRVLGLNHARLGVLALSGLLLNLTALWAVACASIYVRPHPRLEASRWMRENLPLGSTIAFETVWDDVVPVGGTAEFQMLDLRLYDQDNPEKYKNFMDVLDRTQYIIISSNRVYGSVPRLPQRWPMTTAYYHALFEDRLGFYAAREWTSYPRLNLLGRWVEFPDDAIDESLSVYDHPRVVLFAKNSDFLPASVAQVLAPELQKPRDDAPLYEYVKSGWRPNEKSLPRPPRVSR